jgi:hypothetical protein
MTDMRYGKPCMTNLPPDLFKDIATEIRNSPKPNYSKMHAECDVLRNNIIAERKRENGR